MMVCRAPEPVVCVKRGGTTPNHLEPGGETPQRRGYWREARWESRSVRHPQKRGQGIGNREQLAVTGPLSPVT